MHSLNMYTSFKYLIQPQLFFRKILWKMTILLSFWAKLLRIQNLDLLISKPMQLNKLKRCRIHTRNRCKKWHSMVHNILNYHLWIQWYPFYYMVKQWISSALQSLYSGLGCYATGYINFPRLIFNSRITSPIVICSVGILWDVAQV